MSCRSRSAWMLVLATACAMALAVLAATSARAHGPRHQARKPPPVPQGFVGMNLSDPFFDPRVDQTAQFKTMVSAGVESVRVVFNWAQAQPTDGGPISFDSDRPGRGAGGVARADGAARGALHARLGRRTAHGRHHGDPRRRRTVRGLREGAGAALRPRRQLLARAPHRPAPADPDVADLERAQLHVLLAQAAVCAELRRAREGGASGDQERRSRRQGGSRRDAELRLGLPRRHLQGARRAVGVRHRLGQPVHRAAQERDRVPAEGAGRDDQIRRLQEAALGERDRMAVLERARRRQRLLPGDRQAAGDQDRPGAADARRPTARACDCSPSTTTPGSATNSTTPRRSISPGCFASTAAGSSQSRRSRRSAAPRLRSSAARSRARWRPSAPRSG